MNIQERAEIKLKRANRRELEALDEIKRIKSDISKETDDIVIRGMIRELDLWIYRSREALNEITIIESIIGGY
jgi:hypothetical protein